MPSFKDSNGDDWIVEVKMRSIEAVRHLCKGTDDKPVDLLAIAERGRLDQLVEDIGLVVNVVFVLCADQVRDRFDLEKYDADNAHMYEMIPEWASEPAMVKASRWFGQRLGDHTLLALVDTFQEALIDFFPNESRRTALKLLMEKKRELDRLEGEEMMQQINKAFDQAVPAIREAAKRRGEKVSTYIGKEFSDASPGNVPESSE